MRNENGGKKSGPILNSASKQYHEVASGKRLLTQAEIIKNAFKSLVLVG
jgi:hypothetical protein